MVDVMDGCVVMDGWMSVSLRWMNVCVWVDEWVGAIDGCVCGGGGTDDVWNMDCELFCAVERRAVR